MRPVRYALALLALTACAGLPSPPPTPCPEPAARPPCSLPPPAPRVDWVSPGCPPKFGSCLTGSDSAALSAYLQASRQWMTRCSDGR